MEEQFVQDLREMNEKVMGVVEQTCEAVLVSGFAKAGHNGPYGNPETPVRNTACWLVGFSEAYRISDHARFFDAAKSCADYLMEEENRPGGGAFIGSQPGWERWDGLMGQAWVMEALCEFYRLTGESPYLETAREVFLMHGFDDGAGLWKKLGIKGEILATDKILHHQLWFAAAGALLAQATGDTRIQQRVEGFLDKLESNLLVYPDGLIMQRIVPSKLGAGSLSFLNKGLGYLKRAVVNPLTGRGLRYKEVAYQITNLYAFAMLKNAGYGDAFFQTRRFARILGCGFSETMLAALDRAAPEKDTTGPSLKIDMPVNRYAYPYNAPGFALPYVYVTFRDWLPDEAKAQVKRVVDWQIETNFCEETGRFARHTEDVETLNARVYQFLRCALLFESEKHFGQ